MTPRNKLGKMTEETNDRTPSKASEKESATADKAAPGTGETPETSPQSGEDGDLVEKATATDETGAKESGEEDKDPETQIAELEDKLLRARADMENLRRRFARELEEKAKYAATAFARDLLNAADNLQRALDSISPEVRKQDETLEAFAAGVEAIEREILSAFDNHDIRKIEPLDEKFDPEFHQAMYEVENTDCPPGTVVEVVQPGYLLHDRLLRPAMVGVAKGKLNEESVDTTI
ncbi:MAG: nucleotide exchange factor GrpE [Alphaproteobacteria bacterium]|nr:nucleotide exchange factor GrpE [Alphaproteobacteria bacterium]